jgi:MFS family permease
MKPAIGVALVSRFVASFHPRALPPMLRATYGRELLAWCFLPVMLAAVEGGAMGNIVKKAFSGAAGVDESALNFAVAAVVAAPALANITSFLWAGLAHGRGKIRFIVGLQLATVVTVCVVGMAGDSVAGLYLVVAMVILSRVFWTGVLTLRTSVWANNYPRADRAGIAGKLATVQSAITAAVGITIGSAMDLDERSFHWIFPVTAVLGLVGVAIYSRVRLRGQRRLARQERAGRAHERLSLNPFSVGRVLAGDPVYRRFMLWMFIFGLGNLMLTAPLAVVLHETFDVEYTDGILITSSIAAVIAPISIPAWARLMRHRHILQFRSIHAWSYVTASLCLFLGSWLRRIELMYLAAVFTGIGNGGGALAWNLGHHDFAPPGRDAQYMGVHVTLTGIRGLIAPFLAVGIYEAFDARSSGAGVWVFLICFLINAAGAVGFTMMNRSIRLGRIRLRHMTHDTGEVIAAGRAGAPPGAD